MSQLVYSRGHINGVQWVPPLPSPPFGDRKAT
jgi:hypothetical protein